jgi:tRNA-dihydrouridine synthase
MDSSSSGSNTRIYMAPLQGFTDYVFRNAFCTLFGAPYAAFSPFIETRKPDGRTFRDVLPERNTLCRIIPQVLGNDADEMIPVIKQLQDMGYDEVNWNLGCPYPMVTKKTLGAGLLPFPERIDSILDAVLGNITCRFTVKMRLGLSRKDEWKALLPVLNRYPLHEVIIHARTATQMYKGDIDINEFIEFSKLLDHPQCYNGNIFSLEQMNSLVVQLPHISRWMLGRGLLANPLLMQEIHTGQKVTDEEIRKALGKLHSLLIDLNTQRLNGPSHVLHKMKPYWEYFSLSLAGYEKELKKIKKSVTLDAYKGWCNVVFNSERRKNTMEY